MTKMNDDYSICVVVMYFKMKFKTAKQCENTVEGFVNSSLSWRGTSVFYSILVNVEPNV